MVFTTVAILKPVLDFISSFTIKENQPKHKLYWLSFSIKNNNLKKSVRVLNYIKLMKDEFVHKHFLNSFIKPFITVIIIIIIFREMKWITQITGINKGGDFCYEILSEVFFSPSYHIISHHINIITHSVLKLKYQTNFKLKREGIVDGNWYMIWYYDTPHIIHTRPPLPSTAQTDE